MGRPKLTFDTKIVAILRKIKFPKAVGGVKGALALKGYPFEMWPEGAWVWFGHTTKKSYTLLGSPSHPSGRIRYPFAITVWQGRGINPARLLYEFFTGEPPPAGNKFHHRLRTGGRRTGSTTNTKFVDVNPAHYRIAGIRRPPATARKNKARSAMGYDPQLSALIIEHEQNSAMLKTIEEVRAAFPLYTQDLSSDIIQATVSR